MKRDLVKAEQFSGPSDYGLFNTVNNSGYPSDDGTSNVFPARRIHGLTFPLEQGDQTAEMEVSLVGDVNYLLSPAFAFYPIGTVVVAVRFNTRWVIVGSGGGCPAANAIWGITLFGVPRGGSWTAFLRGQSTGALPYNISGPALQTALEGLSSIGAGNVRVTTGGGFNYQVEFVETLGHQPITGFLINVISLLGHGVGGTSFLVQQGRTA